MSEKLQLFLSRTKPAIRRHSRSYARMVNAVIDKKKKTWCDNFMLAATLGCVATHRSAFTRRDRAVRSNAAWARPVFVKPPAWSLALRAPATGTKNSACPTPHNRSHPWRDNKESAINRASTMEHPSLVGISGFMIVRYCKH